MEIIIDLYSSIREIYQYGIIHFINGIGHMLDAFLFMYFVHKFFQVKRPIYDKYWYIGGIFMTLLLWMGDDLFHNDLKIWMVSLFAFPFIYTMIFCQENWKLKGIICLVLYIILISLEYLGVGFTYLATTNGKIKFSVFLFVYIVRRMIFKIILFMAVKFLLRYTIRESNHELQRYWYLVGGVCIAEFFVLYILRSHKAEDKKTLIFHLMIDAFCCLIPILLYYIVNLMDNNLKRVQIEMVQKNFIENQEQYLTQILTMQDSLKQFRHDYKSHLFCIDSLIQEKNYEELHNYLKELHKMVREHENFVLYSGDNRLNIILNQKYEMACKKGVHFSIIVKNILLEKISFYELNMLLSNLCDNAIEGAQDTQEKSVCLFMEKDRAYIQIMMKNSVKGDLLKNNPSFVTSKKDKDIHGLGMQIIRNVVEKYQGVIQFEGDEGWLKINILLLDEEE